MRAASPRGRVTGRENDLSPRRVRDALGIPRERLARLLDVSTRAIERWEEQAEQPPNRTAREGLAKLQRIIDLGLTVYDPPAFHQFLTLPMPVFGGWTALQLIEQGEADRVYGALAADYEGQGF